MRTFALRSAIAVGLVATLALAAPVVASAGDGPGGRNGGGPGSTTTSPTSANNIYRQAVLSYRNSKLTIQLTFQSAVNAARSAYFAARAKATTSAQRSTAQQALRSAIIQAAAVRSAALNALGNPPVKPS